MLFFDCNFKLDLCSCVCVVISDTKKEASRNFLFETAQLPQVRYTQNVARILKRAVSKELNSLFKRLKYRTRDCEKRRAEKGERLANINLPDNSEVGLMVATTRAFRGGGKE